MAFKLTIPRPDFFRPTSLERISLGLKIALGILTCLIIGWTIYLIEREKKEVEETLVAFEHHSDAMLNVQSEAPAQRNKSYNAIIEKSLFGNVGPKEDPKKNIPTNPESDKPLSLIGVFLPPGGDSYAIIQDDKSKEQDVFGVNETIFDVAKLTKVFTDKVEIVRNGQTETLVLETGKPGGGGESNQSDSTDTIVLSRTELDQALQNIPLLLTQARAVPFFKDGKAVGLRMFAIRSGSLFEKIGLQNGDILETVNGNSLGDLSQAMQLFQTLKDENEFSLKLQRNLGPKEMRYQIR